MKGSSEKKYQKVRNAIGITAAVYLGFKYLLPLVIPFLLAGILAYCLFPFVRYIHRVFHLKESIIFTGILLLIGCGLWWLFSFFFVYSSATLEACFSKISMDLENFKGLILQKIEIVEKQLGLSKGVFLVPLSQMLEELDEYIKELATKYCLPGTIGCIKKLASWFTSLFVALIASILFIEERKALKKRFEKSSFYMEGKLLIDQLKYTAGNYLKVESKILLLTIGICLIGLWILGIKNFILKSIIIGVLDAFPLFGSGTIFVPWIVICLIKKEFLRAFELGIIYLICYSVREFMENHLMGEYMGITALEFLASVYVGLKLFGMMGFVLGPIGYLVIRLGLKMI